MKLPFSLFFSFLFYCFNPSIQLLARRRFLKQGKFIVDYLHQLVAPPLKIVNVSDVFDCTLECIENDECLSFNLPVQNSIDGLKMCQLLSTDKYASPQLVKANATFDLHTVDIGLPAGKTSPPCEFPMEFHRYYWTGEHKCVCPKVPGAEYGWVKLNNAAVHVESKGDKPGKFHVSQGGQIQKLKLVHLSGAMTCWLDGPNHYPTKFGCGENFHMFITDINKKVKAPLDTDYEHQYYTYTIKCSKTNDSQVILRVDSSPFTVAAGEELQVWYGEDLANIYDGDNIGSVDLDVYANFTFTP